MVYSKSKSKSLKKSKKLKSKKKSKSQSKKSKNIKKSKSKLFRQKMLAKPFVIIKQYDDEKSDSTICNQVNKQYADFSTLLSPERLYWDKCYSELSCNKYVDCIKRHIPTPILFRPLNSSPFTNLPVHYTQQNNYEIYIFEEQKGQIDLKYLNKYKNKVSKEKNGIEFINWFPKIINWNKLNITLFITKKHSEQIIGYVKGKYDSEDRDCYVIDWVAVDQQYSGKGVCKQMINTLCNFLYFSKPKITQIKIYPTNYSAYKCYMKIIGQYYPFFNTEEFSEHIIKSPIQLATNSNRDLKKYLEDFSFYSIEHDSNI